MEDTYIYSILLHLKCHCCDCETGLLLGSLQPLFSKPIPVFLVSFWKELLAILPSECCAAIVCLSLKSRFSQYAGNLKCYSDFCYTVSVLAIHKGQAPVYRLSISSAPYVVATYQFAVFVRNF